MTKERNAFVDFMRGIAMLLVVLGHTLLGSTSNSESSFLYNIIWSLQMPLFIMISGYVTRYSKEIKTIGELSRLILRRTTAYLLPFAVWSFLIRGLILGQGKFLDIKYMLWHLSDGYWFLITIWTISIIFEISNYISSFAKKPVLKQLILILVYICGMSVLGVIGYFVGMSFFAIKLTLYYMSFYFAGYIYGQYRDKIFSLSFGKISVDIAVAISFVLWIFTLSRFNLFEISDSGLFIVLRAGASMLGCIAVCGLFGGLFKRRERERKFSSPIVWTGVHSLEIYLVHYLFLNLITTTNQSYVFSIKGIVLTVLNFLIVITATIVVITLINSNRALRFFLFGKKTTNR